MAILDHLRWHVTAVLALPLALSACGGDLDTSVRRPPEPLEAELFDLVDGPLDRASALDVVSGRGFNRPRVVRLDQSAQWDVAFAMIDDEPVWLPRGFFDGIEPSAGIRLVLADFEDVERLPNDRDQYEFEEPVPVTLGGVYGIRSRPDPSLSLPCHIYAKLVVDAVEGDPARVRIRFLWNPNCDDTNVTPGESG